jgi:hypothetical protein
MKHLFSCAVAALIAASLGVSSWAQTESTPPKKNLVKSQKSTSAPIAKTAPSEKNAASSPEAKAPSDTLVVIARITEIPGKFAANDLYNYVYVMKYRVLSVVKGSFKGQDILVGHYNPLIPRSQIKDAMKKNVAGNVEKMEVGGKHKLWLITPVDKVWKDAVDDEYSDSDMEKYYAVKADIAP